jgi:hypothetical protein
LKVTVHGIAAHVARRYKRRRGSRFIQSGRAKRFCCWAATVRVGGALIAFPTYFDRHYAIDRKTTQADRPIRDDAFVGKDGRAKHHLRE